MADPFAAAPTQPSPAGFGADPFGAPAPSASDVAPSSAVDPFASAMPAANDPFATTQAPLYQAEASPGGDKADRA
eukprot:scaffold3159_cov393-Prasinococcus_capsulatus_cf.AAC.10